MAKIKTSYRCSECGATEPKWTGRCAGCEAWGTLVEELDDPGAGPGAPVVAIAPRTPPVPISEVDPTEFVARPTGIEELDRVLGGGLVPGSVT
jgi:DNA repair protein RadA/Sms